MISVKRWISALIVAGWCVVPMPGQQPGSMEARPAGEERLHNVLSRQRLEPPLHNDLTQLQFSPDGKFALAQDETGIYALSRRPFAYLFRIEAPYAYPAHFTPDSGGIVYYDAKLTVEKWDVSSQARAWVHQIVLPKPCRQTALSPDGGVLACLDQENGLNLLDSSTGNAVFSKKEFIPWYQAQTFPAFPGAGPPGGGPAEMIGMQFSPDGRYFVACRGPSNIAVDLTTYKPISLPGRVKELLERSFAFMGPNRLAGLKTIGGQAAVVKFPSGAPLFKDMPVGVTSLSGVTGGDYLLLRPARNYAVGVLDPKTSRVMVANPTPALDVFDQTYLSEEQDGEVGLFRIDPAKEPEAIGRLSLPASRLGLLTSFDVSADFKLVAVAQAHRAGLWDLGGKQPPLRVRDFQGAWFAADGQAYLDFPELDKDKRAIVHVDPTHMQFLDRREVVEDPPAVSIPPMDFGGPAPPMGKFHRWSVQQRGPYLITIKPRESFSPFKNVDLEIADFRTNSLLWSLHLPKERPLVDIPSGGDAVVLSWPMSAAAAQDIVGGSPQLKAAAALEANKEGYLLRVLDAKNGAVKTSVVVGTGKGSFLTGSFQISGDWLLAVDNWNRSILVSLATGDLKGKFSGTSAISKEAGLLAAEDTPGQVSLYALADSAKRDEFVFAEPVVRLRFSGDGKRLFALTGDQSAYVVGVNP